VRVKDEVRVGLLRGSRKKHDVYATRLLGCRRVNLLREQLRGRNLVRLAITTVKQGADGINR
jgi:hypothetical protein